MTNGLHPSPGASRHPLPWGEGVLVAIAVVLCGCPEQAAPKQDPQVIATVNGEVVSRVDFEKELSRELQGLEGQPSRTPEQIEPYKQALLDTMVTRAVLLQAATKAGVVVSPEEIDRRVLALASEYPAESFDAALNQGQLSKDELQRNTKNQLIIERLFQEQVYTRVGVTEEAIRRYYDEHPDDFQEPEQVHAQQIVVKGLDDAKKLQQQLWAGKKFSDLARRYSLTPDAKVGGDLGFFAKGVMPPQFDEVVFKLAPGSVSEVVSTDYGFHLFKVIEKKPARKKELSEVRADIEQKLLAQLKEKGQAEFVKALKEKAEVKVNDTVLLAVTGRPTAVKQTEP